jgi:hypothetical protein
MDRTLDKEKLLNFWYTLWYGRLEERMLRKWQIMRQ